MKLMPIARAQPSAMLRRIMGDIFNRDHYNESNNRDYLPPLIPDELEDFYELPSIHDNKTEENKPDSDFSIRQYEESGGSIASVMRNWAESMRSIFNPSESTSTDVRRVVTDPSGKPVKLYEFKDVKPDEINGSCSDDEGYELPSLVDDDI